MDTSFICSGCNSEGETASTAVVIISPQSFSKVLIFCNDCYCIHLGRALESMESEQRLVPEQITLYIWVPNGPVGFSFANTDELLQYIKASEDYISKEANEVSKTMYADERDSSEAGHFVRRIRRMLLSAVPELSYPRNFKALYFLLRGSISEGPEKL